MNKTETVVLGTVTERQTVTKLVAKDGLISTETFRPGQVESASPQNPQPVEGYAEEPEISAIMESMGDVDATETDDGRYLAVPEVIIGPDDRTQVPVPQAWPYSVHGHMVMRFPNGKVYIGSGTMVNGHHVLTAGHCVHSMNDGGWATSIQFNAAQNGTNLPFGSASAVRLLSVTGWTKHANSEWDYAMLILDQDLGERTGWFGVITFTSDVALLRHRVNVTGYPGDKGGRQMWTHADAIKSVSNERFYYDIDTMGGQSGSGVNSTWEGHQGEKVAGVHTTGSSSGNGATRISRSKFDRIIEWFNDY